MSVVIKRRIALFCLLCSLTSMADSFKVTDIRIQGLQRVSAGTVFNLIPINVGDEVDEVSIRQLIRVIFQSGFFRDVRIARDDGVLILTVMERPAIDSIKLQGNKAIKSDALLKGLADQGLKEGEIFKKSTLERVNQELERQYVSQGRYGASVDTESEELPRNRVAIKINIVEGKTAAIQHINIVGDKSYSRQELLNVLELKLPSLLSFYKNDDKYSREKLSGDMKKLESFYQDRGYVQFQIQSTQVSITPEKQQVYITLNINEGEKYTVAKSELVGELNDIQPDAIKRLLLVKTGQTFSQALVTASEDRITRALGNAGYTFATASGIPQVHDDGTVDVKFFVDANKRAYVRRIKFEGNTITQDEVLRREMRQMEGGWASTALIDLSKVRLERLGYFKGVNVETPEVPGTEDQIDVDFSVEEQPSGSISATLGFAQGTGLILGGGYQEKNVLGTGNSLGLNVSWSQFQKSVSFNYFNPYFTLDGISRGFNLFFRRSDFGQQNIARFNTDSVGAGINFGFPIGETQRINFGFNAEYTDITEGLFPVLEISEFLADEGSQFVNYKFNGSWSSSALNRGLFPTAGRSQSLKLELSAPGSDLTFYKVEYRGQMYFPLNDAWTVHLRTKLGFAERYGSTNTVPFFEHFFGGGFGSVRGFKVNTLGPGSTPPPNDPFTRRAGGDPFGGNLLVEGSAELIFPLPFVKDQRQFRPVIFLDAGNVFNTNCPSVSRNCSSFDTGDLRYSVGIGVTWLAGLGPMTFAIAKPLNEGPFDRTEIFQFELGKTF